MGIDIRYKHKRSSHRSSPKSENPYLRLLVRLYRFLARRTDSRFDSIILRRLMLSRNNRPPVSLSKIAKYTKNASKENIAVIVSKVTNDERLVVVPKMTVAALSVSETARSRIEKVGGRVITLDQLALERPTGKNTTLLQGARHARKAFKFFPMKGKKQKPRTRSKGKTLRQKK